MNKKEIDNGLVVFEQIQRYGYFNSYKLSIGGGAIGVLNNPVFNPVFITKYSNIHRLLKIAAGGWLKTALVDSKHERAILDKLVLLMLQSTQSYDGAYIEKLLRKELNL